MNSSNSDSGPVRPPPLLFDRLRQVLLCFVIRSAAPVLNYVLTLPTPSTARYPRRPVEVAGSLRSDPTAQADLGQLTLLKLPPSVARTRLAASAGHTLPARRHA
jgi:hypothetical protein